MSAGVVLDDSLIVHTAAIRSGLDDTVRENPHISADLGRGTSDFSTGHFLPLNQPDYLHEYSPCYDLSGEVTSTKFIRY
jgi:hypothetical protein